MQLKETKALVRHRRPRLETRITVREGKDAGHQVRGYTDTKGGDYLGDAS